MRGFFAMLRMTARFGYMQLRICSNFVPRSIGPIDAAAKSWSYPVRCLAG